jgi:hypothetical protein
MHTHQSCVVAAASSLSQPMLQRSPCLRHAVGSHAYTIMADANQLSEHSDGGAFVCTASCSNLLCGWLAGSAGLLQTTMVVMVDYTPVVAIPHLCGVPAVAKAQAYQW